MKTPRADVVARLFKGGLDVDAIAQKLLGCEHGREWACVHIPAVEDALRRAFLKQERKR